MNTEINQPEDKLKHGSHHNVSKHSVNDSKLVSFQLLIRLDKKNKAESNKEVADQSQETESEDDDFDDANHAEAIKKKHERGHKTISAEAYGQYNKKGDFKAKVIPKTAEQKQRIIQRLEKAFMFSALDDKEKHIVVDAMQERLFKYNYFLVFSNLLDLMNMLLNKEIVEIICMLLILDN